MVVNADGPDHYGKATESETRHCPNGGVAETLNLHVHSFLEEKERVHGHGVEEVNLSGHCVWEVAELVNHTGFDEEGCAHHEPRAEEDLIDDGEVKNRPSLFSGAREILMQVCHLALAVET